MQIGGRGDDAPTVSEGAAAQTTHVPTPTRSAAQPLWSSEWPFVVALVAGLLVRILVQYAFPQAFVFSDGPTYLQLADDLHPSPERPVGYAALLALLSHIDRGVDFIAVIQHLLGLATAVVAYALLRRKGVSALVATLAVLPILFDGMMLALEHSVLSDVLFQLLLLVAIAVLAWRPSPRLWQTATTGLLLGVATIVRIVGVPSVVVAAVFVVLVVSTMRARVVQIAVLVAAFALPVGAYATWYHHDNGAWSLTQSGGLDLYMRTTSFVDCADLTVPSYERTLCPADPLGARHDPTYYGVHDPRTTWRLQPPVGVSADAAERDFAKRAIRQQPVRYAAIVGRDFALPFITLDRGDRYEYHTAYKWQLGSWVDYQPTDYTGPAYAAHGGEYPHTRHPLGDWLGTYGHYVVVPGPVLLLLVVVSVAGLVVRRRSTPGLRPLILLLVALPLVLSLVPDLTAQFTWRYQLPLVGMLPLAAALAWARLHRRPTDTPSAG